MSRKHVDLAIKTAKFAAIVTLIGAVISAISYVVHRPSPVYEGGKLILTTRFIAHDNGFPLTYIHNTCYGVPLVCHQYFDWWAFAANTLFLALAITLGWFAFKGFVHLRKRR